MGREYDAIDDRLAAFLLSQPVFFTATAPLASDGRVNVSPKGLSDTFAVLGPNRVAYLDLTGSGVETIAHLRENGRITLMFCAFEGPPRIVRLHGHGEVLTNTDPRWADLLESFCEREGMRSIVVVDVERIADSCGYGVPDMTFVGDRRHLAEWAARKGPDGLVEYQLDRNARSIDGLPGIDADDLT